MSAFEGSLQCFHLPLEDPQSGVCTLTLLPRCYKLKDTLLPSIETAPAFAMLSHSIDKAPDLRLPASTTRMLLVLNSFGPTHLG